MVVFLVEICDLCRQPGEMATPDKRQSAGLADLAITRICTDCLRRLNPAALPADDRGPRLPSKSFRN